MPRPPILPQLDWAGIFRGALEWDAWLSRAEFPDKRDAMEKDALTLHLPDEAAGRLVGMAKPVHVVAIAEDWCGDVVRHAPVMQRLALAQPLIRLRMIARHDHPEVFVRFLTNGGEAIPKIVFLSDQFIECGNWGPMPEVCRQWIARGKACGNVAAARGKVKELYDADPGRVAAFLELSSLADLAATVAIG
jgi:hypothetical protein